jgi:eukaryotic-like serine/threonine-protein kinase
VPCDLSLLPEAIRPKAEELAKNIDFSRLNEKGASGYVLVGYNKVLQRDVVVKFYFWGGGDHAEPALLAKLESDYILQVYHAESINQDDAFFMTPYCAEGDLDDTLTRRKFGTVEAIDVLSQIAAGTSFLHGSGYLHRDLKPANLFCNADGRFVIGDFGSVVLQNADGFSLSKTKHSVLYRPPEELSEGVYYRQGDVYQLGMVLYQILGGYLPYEERLWLSEKQQQKYDSLSGWQRRDYFDPIIKRKIKAGRILDLVTLPPWTPPALKTVIRTCSAVARDKRFAAVADLTGHLNNIRSKIPDWRFDEHPVLCRGKKRFRIVSSKKGYVIEKSVGASWRTERACKPETLEEAVLEAQKL